jgi:hypothetical protein
MRTSRRERGEGQMGCLFSLIVLAIAIFVAWKLIPIKVKAAEVRQTVVDEAKSAGSHDDSRIKGAILRMASQNSLPVTEDSIKIVRPANEIIIDVNYTVPVEFPGFTYQWHINHHQQNPVF